MSPTMKELGNDLLPVDDSFPLARRASEGLLSFLRWCAFSRVSLAGASG